MTIRRYSFEEALDRIFRVLQGKTPSSDVPNSMSGEIEGWDTTLSKMAELFQNSLPGEALIFPSWSSRDEEYAFAYLSTGTATPVASGGWFYPVLGPFVNNPVNGFSLAVDKIQYDGAGPKEFEILWSTALYSDNGNRTLHVGISINDETLVTTSPSVMGSYMKSGEPVVITGVYVIALSPNDTIQLQASSSIDSDTLQVEHFTTSIKRFSGA
ncbi:MAG: hypothetical protein ACXADY_18355 [Candidatus Hodarchaeales archaeon]|jgi:hypothetical protein